jgi:uncharacterized protein with HEPN domain
MRDYLGHLVEAIERIQNYTGGLDAAAFAASPLVQDAVIRNLEVIGEACRNVMRVDPGFAVRFPELPLAAAYDMRNVLAHAYFKVDLAIVWRTVTHELPALGDQVRAVRAQLAEDVAS